jgi:hypothetical protein
MLQTNADLDQMAQMCQLIQIYTGHTWDKMRIYVAKGSYIVYFLL